MVPMIGMACSIEKGDFILGGSYVRAIEHAGGVVVGIPPAEQFDRILSVLDKIDGLLLPGGADVDPHLYNEEILPENGSLEPERDRLEIALARWALQNDVPILGICRGMQVLNVAAGGTLYQDIPSQTDSRLQHRQKAPRWYATHAIDVDSDTRLAEVFGKTSLRINTFHHQAVRDVAPGFIASARASDGIIEAIEARKHRFAIGLQWHPEAMIEKDPMQMAVFEAFIAEAKIRQRDDSVGERAG